MILQTQPKDSFVNQYRAIVVLMVLSIGLLALAQLFGNTAYRVYGIDSLDQEQLTPARGFDGINCGCPYPPCGCLQITLEPTTTIAPIATFPNPATPEIPMGATVYATFTTYAGFPTPVVTQVPTSKLPTALPIPPTPVNPFGDF